MATIESRIEALEKAMEPVGEPVRLMMYVHDASKAGHDTPDRLTTVIHSGTPEKPGRKYSREPEETEETFLDRIEAAEAGEKQ